jgi:hypothetical protein
MPKKNPSALGMIIFRSRNLQHPVTTQKKLLHTEATVNGKGMDLADLSRMTVFMAAKGDANMATQKIVATVPTTLAGMDKNDKDATIQHSTHNTATK